jgi:hypothetical protein
MDSVKWLRRILVLGRDDRHSSFIESGMDRVYNRVTIAADGIEAKRLHRFKSIAWPPDKMRLAAGLYEYGDSLGRAPEPCVKWRCRWMAVVHGSPLASSRPLDPTPGFVGIANGRRLREIIL